MTAKIDARSLGGMTHYLIEGTKEEVQEVIDRVERRYHPMGYGTSFYPIKERDESGTFYTIGSHSNSCD